MPANFVHTGRFKMTGACQGEESSSSPVHRQSASAILNDRVIRKLQRALKSDPEANLLDLIPHSYSTRLANGKETGSSSQTCEPSHRTFTEDGKQLESERTALQRYALDSEHADIIFSLSPQVRSLLKCTEQSQKDPDLGRNLSECLSAVIDAGEKLWPPPSALGMKREVVSCGQGLLLKITLDDGIHIEHHTLEYLARFKPDFPVPRSHGVIVAGRWRFFFMSFIPGSPLSSVWPTLKEHEKIAISKQLNELFVELRALPFPVNSTLGSVSGQVCLDARREVRMTKETVRSIDEFDDFRFSKPTYGGNVYIRFLRQMSRDYQPSKICFTHGDVRPANIIASQQDNGSWMVNGIIDWEMSGFYPEDFESTKITNTMHTNEDNDWFLFLPECISPSRYSTRWALDRIWAAHVQ